jgi:PDZ domain/Aspartyl protease
VKFITTSLNRFLLLGLLLAAFGQVWAQPGFIMPKGRKQVDIPFEYISNFIVLTVRFNGPVALKFIFDTGAEHTILCKREISDLLQVQYEREFRVTGSDLRTTLIAYLARSVELELPNQVRAPREDLLVLDEDYFRFEEYTGVNIHGILSGNVFARYIFKINYAKRIITLYERNGYQLRDNGFKSYPLELYRNKIYLNTHLEMLTDSITPVKLLIDTGAGLPLLLFTNTHPLLQPPANAIASNIGMGLGGYLQGFVGRTKRLDLGTLSQKGIVTYFQTLDSIINPESFNHRNGLIGNVALNRFHVIFDYYGERLWLKPGKYYRTPFEYDRSGLSVIASGRDLNKFIVNNVLPGSPAEVAGLRRGDELLRIGMSPASLQTLNNIQRMLQGKPGKKINITLRRDGERMKKVLVLRELLK